MLPVAPVAVAGVGRGGSRKVGTEMTRRTPSPNEKAMTYLEVANVQFSHFLGANPLAVKPNLGSKMIVSHVFRQRAAIQQGPGLAAHARQERLARDLHQDYFRTHRTRIGGGRGGGRGRGRRRDTLKGAGWVL
jgi:hypothetical protein